MELHEFQGASSLPHVVVINHLFLKITTSNLIHLYLANRFFLVYFMHEKKSHLLNGIATNPLEHKMKRFLKDCQLWSQEAIDNMIG